MIYLACVGTSDNYNGSNQLNKMVCFNDPALNVCVWLGWWGEVADTNYLYPALWGWINRFYAQTSDLLKLSLEDCLYKLR